MADHHARHLAAAFAACMLAWAGASKGQAPPSAQGEPAGVELKVTPPAVLKEPSRVAFIEAEPTVSPQNQNGGAAKLHCTLKATGVLADCSIESETPEGSGFGAAALKLAPLYRLSPRVVEGAPVTGPIIFNIVFPPAPGPGFPPGSHFVKQEAKVDHPWTKCEQPARPPSRYYPWRAQALRMTGAAEVQCRVRADGAMSSCAWISEAPKGFGFGDAAAKLGCLFHAEATEPAFPIVRTRIQFQLR